MRIWAKMKRTESWISPGGGISRATKARMMPKVRRTMAVHSLSFGFISLRLRLEAPSDLMLNDGS